MVHSTDFDENPDFTVPWLERWQAADFSWRGLAKHDPWIYGQSGTLQDYFARVEKGATEAELIKQGWLVDCGEAGLHHVIFVPEEWVALGQANVSLDALSTKKQQGWHKLFTDGGLKEHVHAVIRGAHPPPDFGQRLITSFPRLSFEWTRFRSDIRNIARKGDRSFTWCLFVQNVVLGGPVNSEGGPSTLHFTWCDFDERMTLTEVSGLDLLDINGSNLPGGVDISDSQLKTLRINSCDLKYINMGDCHVAGPLNIGASTLRHIEWINCTFDQHVLLVDVEVRDSVGLLACDFTNRVTLATIAWPKQAYDVASSSGSKFDGIVVIEGGEPPPVQLFQEADFRSKVSVNWFSDREKRESFKRELAAAENRADEKFDLKKHAENVESGCRTLRKVAEVAGDVQSEQLWHRAELIARRVRGDSGASEKAFSKLYGLLADYGLSIARPFAALIVSTVVFAGVYAWLGGHSWLGSIDYEGVQEGFGYSLNRTIPIGVFADEGNAWRDRLLGSGGELHHILIRLLATSQTIFSAVLIYLGVMAIRRKFRIS